MPSYAFWGLCDTCPCPSVQSHFLVCCRVDFKRGAGHRLLPVFVLEEGVSVCLDCLLPYCDSKEMAFSRSCRFLAERNACQTSSGIFVPCGGGVVSRAPRAYLMDTRAILCNKIGYSWAFAQGNRHAATLWFFVVIR